MHVQKNDVFCLWCKIGTCKSALYFVLGIYGGTSLHTTIGTVSIRWTKQSVTHMSLSWCERTVRQVAVDVPHTLDSTQSALECASIHKVLVMRTSNGWWALFLWWQSVRPRINQLLGNGRAWQQLLRHQCWQEGIRRVIFSKGWNKFGNIAWYTQKTSYVCVWWSFHIPTFQTPAFQYFPVCTL